MEGSQGQKLIALAIFALIAAAVVAAILICRGGGNDGSTTTVERRRLQAGRGAETEDVSYEAPKQTVKKGEKLTAVVKPAAARSRSRWTPSRAPKTVNSFVFLSEAGLLRRPHLPPGRARLRHPGRRPARQRHRRPRLQRRREAPRQPGLHERAPSRWPRARRSRRALRQPVLRRHRAPTPGCRPNTRWSATSNEGLDVVERIGRLGTPPKNPKQTVLIEKITIEKG